MKRLLYLLAGLLPTTIIADSSRRREGRITYDGYRVLRLPNAGSVQEQIASIHHLTLNPGTRDHLDIVIAPEDTPAFEALGLGAEVVYQDLGHDVRIADGNLPPYRSTRGQIPSMEWFEDYHHYDDHLLYLHDLHAAFANHSELITTGESYEGRPIQGIHFWGSAGKGARPAVLWHGTVHAREWITPKTTEYLAHQLIKGYINGTAEVVEIVNKFDFYVFPVVNPDGFIYSFERDRLWRKNRQPRDNTTCMGTDLNRNWPFKWDLPGGASDDPCHDTFRGEAPGDTPEMKGIRSLVDQLAEGRGIRQYIDWHSFGEYILLPFGYDCDAVAADFDAQMLLAGATAEVIETFNGTAYTYGSSCRELYATTGSSVDYVYGKANAELAWTVELPPVALGVQGFLLHPDMIIPASNEMWHGIKWLLANI